MRVEDRVRAHYSRSDLAERVRNALDRVGVDLSDLQVDDLGGLDQLHAGGRAATEHVLDRLELSDSSRLLDVGCGVGGPSRLAAALYGCQVSGIDLSSDFVSLARDLTERVGMSDRVTFEQGSATALPFEDASRDRAMIIHAGMNIEEKGRVFSEVRRVLRPDGLFAVYEEMRTGEGDLEFPLPWAEHAEESFVETRETYVALLGAAGFTIESDEAPAGTLAGPPAPGELNPADLFGPEFVDRIANAITATMSGILAPVLVVARAT